MTRASILLTIVVFGVSLGVSAQNNSPGSAAAPSPSSAQLSSQSAQASPTAPGQPATPGAAPSAPQSTAAAHDSSPRPATAKTQSGIESLGSASGEAVTGTAEAQLPQTSTILPLLGLIGLGSLVAGLFARR